MFLAGEGQLGPRRHRAVGGGGEDFAGAVFGQQGAVGMEAAADAPGAGMADHVGQAAVEEGFASVVQIDVGDKGVGLVENAAEQVQRHQAFFGGREVLVGAHDAPEVARGGGVEPEADGPAVQPDAPRAVLAGDLRHPPGFQGEVHRGGWSQPRRR